MSKALKISAVILLVVIIAELFYLFFLAPKPADEPITVPDPTGIFTVTERENGTLVLSWDAVSGVDAYTVDIASGGESIYKTVCASNSCAIPEAALDRNVTITLTTTLTVNSRRGDETLSCEKPLTVSTFMEAPEVSNVIARTDGTTRTLTLSWYGPADDSYTVYAEKNGELKELKTVTGNSVDISYAEGGDIEMPSRDETITFWFSSDRQSDGITYIGAMVETISITRDHLLDTRLTLTAIDNGYNSYTIRWNPTRGDRYELQLMNKEGSGWDTLAVYDSEDDLVYETGHLEPFTDYSYRVIAIGGQTQADSEYAVQPETVIVSTKESPVYCSIWPIHDLTVYSEAGGGDTLGTAKAANAYTVLEEKDGWFKIFFKNKEGYVDSNYVLINLPEYVGDLISYDIKNSYSAIYRVHEYDIPEITDTVIHGYEHIITEDGYIAPILYPTAHKIVKAALAAGEGGYRLKIYDSFRPREATRQLYDTTLKILNDPLPEDIEEGEEWQELMREDGAVPEIQGEEGGTNPDEAGLDTEEDGRMTYYMLMTNGTYYLGNFLARVGSYHNMGIAVDLTLEYKSNRSELMMQTSMHDLSWYSVVYLNNFNADLLAQYMTGAGFATLSSEWWHFQDNELRDSLKLKTYLEVGLNPMGWKADNNGMRYRTGDGNYYAGASLKIDGVDYTFDHNGYCNELK